EFRSNTDEMLRNIVAVIAGLLVAGAAAMLLEVVVHAIHPPPEDFDLYDRVKLKELMDATPPWVYVAIMLAHLVGTFLGAWLTAAIARGRWQLGLAMIVGFLLMLGGSANMLMIPHPFWAWLEVPLYLVAAWAGGKFG